MARTRSPALRQKFEEMRSQYIRTRKWLNFAVDEIDAMWRMEASGNKHLDPVVQVEHIERLSARLKKYSDFVPADF